MAKVINVVAGVLLNPSQDQVLVVTRPEGKVCAGSWEFPGGKIEVGESALSALKRELNEELGVEVAETECLKFTHLCENYAHGYVELHVFLVHEWQGELVPLEGQQLYWQHLHQRCGVSPLLPTTDKILKLLAKSSQFREF